eukprot:gene11352-15222_t
MMYFSFVAAFIIALISISGTISTSEINDLSSLSLFREWKTYNNKSYESSVDEAIAYHNWVENKNLIDKHNINSNNGWTATMNQFSDLSDVDFKNKFLLPSNLDGTIVHNASKKKLSKASIAYKMNPSTYDWRTDSNVSVVTSVKDQGSVGSCWAFSTIGNIEGQWSLSGNQLIDLSTEYLVDCDGTADYPNNHADCSVFGGWPYLAYDYIIQSNGIPSDESMPYCAGHGDCFPCMEGPVSLCGPPPSYCEKDRYTQYCTSSSTVQKSAKISSWASVSTNEDEIAAILYTQGPLSVLLDATQLQFYKSGIWDGHLASTPPISGCHDSLNHAVLLVGYGEEVQSLNNTNESTSVPYWIVKNSWGVKWGENGYFRIKRGSGTCGINTAVTTSIV